MKAHALLLAAGFTSLASFASAQTATPAFAAADVHVSPVRLHPDIHGSIHGDRVVLRDATVADLISFAYHVDSSDIYNGPTWIAHDRFDINAIAPAKFDDATGLAMLRGLLVDRFKLVVHTESRPLPAFVLSVGKANKMKPAGAAESGGCEFQAPAANSATSEPGMIHFSCHNTTMESLAGFLHDAASPYLNRPVVDKTGLKNGWDFDLKWTYNKPADGSGTSIFDAVDKQLGLKLEPGREATPVVVIDSLSEKPTPNVADIDKILPPPPPASFDVAVIRPANPSEKNFNIQTEGRRVSILFATLQTLIYKSYNIGPNLIENKPKWLDDVHWDVVGTAAANAAPTKPGEQSDLDIDDVNEMVRTLLADRFKLVTHTGSQPSTVYALMADNPKMKKSATEGTPSCKEGPGPDGKDPRIDNPLADRLISCQNMTMAEFANELHMLAGGYIPAPVVDSSGLAGGYDFTLNFSRKQNLNKPSASPSTAATDGSASDPGSGGVAISLFDALQKQLGVKLEKKDSVPVSTLVIDHIEPQPTEN